MSYDFKKRLENAGYAGGGILVYHKLKYNIKYAMNSLSSPFNVQGKETKEIANDCMDAFARITADHWITNDVLKLADAADESSFKKITDRHFQVIMDLYDEKINKSSGLRKYCLKYAKERLVKKYNMQLKGVIDGKNAFFVAKTNYTGSYIAINSEKFASPVFHEYGHFINSRKLPKDLLQEISFSRKFGKFFAIPLLFNAMVMSEKNEPKAKAKTNTKQNKPIGYESSVFDDIRKFAKKYCGILSAAATIPFVLEEYQASIVGQGLAKKYLKTDLAKKLVTKCHLSSALSYTSVPVSIGLAVHLTNKLRDKIAESRKM